MPPPEKPIPTPEEIVQLKMFRSFVSAHLAQISKLTETLVRDLYDMQNIGEITILKKAVADKLALFTDELITIQPPELG